MTPIFSVLDRPNSIACDAILAPNILERLTALNGSANVRDVLFYEFRDWVCATAQEAFWMVAKPALLGARKCFRTVTVIFAVRSPLQILTAIIEFVLVFMIDFRARWRRTMKRFTDQSANSIRSWFLIWQTYGYGKVSVGNMSDNVGTTNKLVFKNSPDGSASAPARRSDPPHSSQIRYFIKTLKPLSGLPDLIRHGKIVSQEVQA